VAAALTWLGSAGCHAAVQACFLDFKTSVLSFQVPTNGDVTITVSWR
jgi:hypothetical protein